MSYPPIEDIVPHEHPMILIDAITESGDQSTTATLHITPETPFFEPDHQAVPAWVGIEYMAQTIAAHAGLKAHKKGAVPQIGFLLGTRSYMAERPYFYLDEHLCIKVDLLFTDEGMGSFKCMISSSMPSTTMPPTSTVSTSSQPLTVAAATITTYEPSSNDIATMISAHNHT